MYSELGMCVFLILAWEISVHAERGMYNDVPWRKCSNPAARSTARTARSTTSGSFASEIERNPALKCAIEYARNNGGAKILTLLEEWKKYLDRDDVELIMAYTVNKCKDGTGAVYLFYMDLNKDSDQHGLDGGKYPVTKNKLQKALLSMGKAMTFPSELHRKENKQLLDKYKDALKDGTLQLKRFTSTSDVKCRFRSSNPFINIIYQNPSYGAKIAEFSFFEYEEEWLLPAFNFGLTVKSVNEDKDPAEVIVEGPKRELCNSAYMFSLGSKHYTLVCFFSSLVIALFTHPGIISIGCH